MSGKPFSTQECDIAVIGAGPAGISSAIRLKVLHPDAQILVIEKSAPYNKIGSVIRERTLELIDQLEVDRKFLGELIHFGEDICLIGINRLQFENGLRLKAQSLGIQIISDCITDVVFEDKKIDHLKGKHGNAIYAKYFIDATGQVALVPKAIGKRKLSGPQMKAAYTYFHSDNSVGIIKNSRCKNGLVWVTPVPYQKEKNTYQILFLSKENTEAVDYINYLNVFPELRTFGLDESICLEDPCGVLGSHIRQYPSFIFDTEEPSGDNWIAIGDANSIFFDKVWSGIDQALQDGLAIETKIIFQPFG